MTLDRNGELGLGVGVGVEEVGELGLVGVVPVVVGVADPLAEVELEVVGDTKEDEFKALLPPQPVMHSVAHRATAKLLSTVKASRKI